MARAFTTVPSARNREEFLAGLRAGLTVSSGGSGSYARLTGEVVRIFAAGHVETLRDVLAGAPSGVGVAASLALARFLGTAVWLVAPPIEGNTAWPANPRPPLPARIAWVRPDVGTALEAQAR